MRSRRRAKVAGTTQTSSIDLVQPTGAAVRSTWPALGQAIDFAKAYPSNVNNPRVDLLCYQASDPSSLTMYVPGLGYLVYGETRSATPNSADYIGDNPFVLECGMSAWLLNGGSADGTANLFYFG
jgi:hypothetical protein